MLDYQILSDDSGKVLAVLSYCPLAMAQDVARQYERVLATRVFRNTMRASTPPAVGARLPELVRGGDTSSLKLALRRAIEG